MALKKDIKQESGYFASYWRITQLRANWLQREAILVISGYKDKNKREGSPASGVMESRSYNVRGQEFENNFAVNSTSDYEDWSQSPNYSKGSVVSYENAIWEASEDISSGGSPPPDNNSWVQQADSKLDRRSAYQYIMSVDPDFSDAEPT